MQIFSLDSPVMNFLSRIADLMILNLLFILCCLPIVTIGASTTALYSVTLKMAKNEESYIAKSFFQAFKDNFKFSTVSWLLGLLIAVIIVVDYNVSPQLSSPFSNILMFFITALTIFYLFEMLYLFPYIARFDNTFINTVKNAALISILNLPYTFLMIIILAAAVVISMFVSFSISGIVWILCGFSLIAYINSLLFRRIFSKYEMGPEESEIQESEN